MRSSFFTAPLLSIVLLLMLGCSSPQPASPTESSDQPRPGGTFRTPAVQDILDMDMSYTGSTGTNATPIKLGYSYLMRMKTGPDIKYSQTIIEPLIAERWEVSPDAKTYTFYLRKGVRFANLPPVNGRELTAADVKWSFEYQSRTGPFKGLTGPAALPVGRFAFMFEGMESIQTPDPYTVIVKFSEGFAPFLAYAASSDNVIMPKEIYEADGHFKDRVVGSGPFMPDLAASQQGTKWVMKKNPTYFEEGKPYLDEVTIVIIKDEASSQAAFRSRQLDYYTASQFHAAEEIKRLAPDAVEVSYSNPPVAFYLHYKKPPFNNPKLRLAVSRGLDRDELIKVLEGGRGEWALAESNVFNDLFTQEEIKGFVKYNPEEARRLVREAGYPDGIQADMMIDSDSNTNKQASELIQAQLQKVGINFVLKPVQNAEFQARRRQRDFTAHFSGEAPRTDLDGNLYLALHPDGGFNFNDVDDPKVTALLLAQRREANPAKRRELHREIIRYTNETATLTPVWRRTVFHFTQPYVRGWHHQADYRSIGSIWNTWLDK